MKHTSSFLVSLSVADTENSEQWVQLLPSGRVTPRDGRGPYFADAEKVVAETTAYYGKELIPIDYEHQTLHAQKNGQPAPAAGWIVELQARSDGLWGKVRWTERATAHIRSGEYKYLSPVFHFAKDGRIRMLNHAALTNRPALSMPAVAASAVLPGDEQSEAGLAELRSLLELDEGSSIGEIVEAVREMIKQRSTAQASAAPDLSAFVPIAELERVTAAYNKLNKGVDEAAANQLVDQHIKQGHLPPFLRGWGIELCSTNRPAFDQFVERTGGSFSHLFENKVPGVPPRSASRRAAASAQGHGLTDEEEEFCRNLGIAPADYAKSNS